MNFNTHPCSLRDVEYVAAPLLLGEVPDELSADDAALQEHIIDSVRNSAGDPDRHAIQYEDLPLKKVYLSSLKEYMEKGWHQSAFRMLHSKSEILIDDAYKFDPHGQKVTFDTSEHHLDFLMVLSDRIGFDAFLPNSPNDLTFVFNLDLHQPQRPLKLKHTDLGFPVNGTALYIGRSRGKDLIYLIMAPNTFINQDDLDDSDDEELLPSKGPLHTPMSGKHYWMMVMFLAFVFQKHFPSRDVYCHTPYPDLDVKAYKHVRSATNILYVRLPPLPFIVN